MTVATAAALGPAGNSPPSTDKLRPPRPGQNGTVALRAVQTRALRSSAPPPPPRRKKEGDVTLSSLLREKPAPSSVAPPPERRRQSTIDLDVRDVTLLDDDNDEITLVQQAPTERIPDAACPQDHQPAEPLPVWRPPPNAVPVNDSPRQSGIVSLTEGRVLPFVPAPPPPADSEPHLGDTLPTPSAPGSPNMKAPDCLVVTEGPNPMQRHPLMGERLVVGQAIGSDVAIAHGAVDHLHAVLLSLGWGLWAVVDQGSKHGTFINGCRVRHGILEAGDLLQVGPVKLRLIATQPHAHPCPRWTPPSQRLEDPRLENTVLLSELKSDLLEEELLLSRSLSARVALAHEALTHACTEVKGLLKRHYFATVIVACAVLLALLFAACS